MAREIKTFQVDDARLIFKNFSGNVGPYNATGDREFSIVLTEEEARGLIARGFNAKQLKQREEGVEPDWYITVTVKFNVKPPRIVMITSRAQTPMTEAMVSTLDYADIKKVDLICNGFDWDINGKKGTSAYLKTMYVTVNEDELERRYAEDAGAPHE